MSRKNYSRKAACENTKKRRAKLQALGLCDSCGKQPKSQTSLRCELCQQKFNTTYNKNAIRDKEKVFEYYGGFKCACCGETNPKFLQLDHVNDDGYKHRKEMKIKGGWNFYKWLVRNNFPDEIKLQVLCANCNFGKRMNGGVCPHVNQEQELLKKLAGIPLTY